MDSIYYIGLDIHKKTIAYCVKRSDGMLIQQEKLLSLLSRGEAAGGGSPGPGVLNG